MITGASSIMIDLEFTQVALQDFTPSDWEALKKVKTRTVNTRIAKAYGKILSAAEELGSCLQEFEQTAAITKKNFPMHKYEEMGQRARSTSQSKKPKQVPRSSLDIAKLQMVPYINSVKPPQEDGTAQRTAHWTAIGPTKYKYEDSAKLFTAQVMQWTQRMYGQSYVWMCYKWLFVLLVQAIVWLPLGLLWLGFFVLVFLAAHVASHPELIVIGGYKVVAAFPAYTAWAGERMLSQAYNSTWDMVR